MRTSSIWSRKNLIAHAVTISSAFTLGCFLSQAQGVVAPAQAMMNYEIAYQSNDVQDQMLKERIAELKQEIFAVAEANTTNSLEELPVTRAELQPLVEELLSISPVMELPEQLAGIEGPWRELWSDDREPGRPGSQIDRTQVYQVITGVGTFYNIGFSESPRGKVTTFLRGQYTPSVLEKGLFITFTDVKFKPGFLEEGTGLVDLVEKAENQTLGLMDFPFDLTVPRGPIGARGFLETLYVDEDMRIASGFNFADKKIDLYVLRRVEGIE